MTDLAALIAAFTTLFVTIDPPGLVPLFIALTDHMTPEQRRATGLRAVAVSAVLLAVFLLLGEAVLGFVGITMPAFRIAGGVLLFLTALDMLFERRQSRREGQAADGTDSDRDPSVFPLALPLIVGPGAITTVILLAGQTQGATDLLAVALVIALNLGLVLGALFAAPYIGHALGKVGINVVTRVLGMLLAALAVQFMLDGLRSSGLVS